MVSDLIRLFVIALFLVGIVVGAVVASLMWWVLK